MKIFGKDILNFKAAKQTIDKEMSAYVSPYYAKSYDNPYNPDTLVRKFGSNSGLDIYEKMKLEDEQIKTCLAIKKNAVLSSGWDIIPAGEKNIQIEQADFLKYAFTGGMAGSFSNDLDGILTAYEFGFSASEVVKKYIAEGRFKGKIGLQKISTRPPQTMEFQLDEHGNIKEMYQNTQRGREPMPVEKFIIFSHNALYDNPYGNSDLRPIYRNYFSKDIIIKFHNMYLERFGVPFAVGKYKDKGLAPKLQTILDNLQAKTSIVIPHSVEIEIHDIAQSGYVKFIETISMHNKAISRGLLLPDLLGYTDSKFGSRANGENETGIFKLVVLKLQRELEELLFEQLIKQLIDINYGIQDDYPRFKFRPLTEEDKNAKMKLVIEAAKIKLFIPTEDDEEHIREVLSLPKRTDDSVLLPVPQVKAIIPDPEDEDDKMISKEKKQSLSEGIAKRKLSRFEERMEVLEIGKRLNADEDIAVKNLSIVLSDILDNTINKAARIINKKDPAAINKFSLTGVGDVRKLIHRYLRTVYAAGRKDAKLAIRKGIKEQKLSENFAVSGSFDLPPAQTLEWFRQHAILITGKVIDDLSADTKRVIMQGLKEGKTTKEVANELEEVFHPYVEGTVIPKGTAEPFMINTIIRTNTTMAYNMGLKKEYEDSIAVEAYEYSAILDDRTTDYCRVMDGQIFIKNNPRFAYPPAHFNCRSIVSPVLVGEDYKLSGIDPINPKRTVEKDGKKVKISGDRQKGFR